MEGVQGGTLYETVPKRSDLEVCIGFGSLESGPPHHESWWADMKEKKKTIFLEHLKVEEREKKKDKFSRFELSMVAV